MSTTFHLVRHGEHDRVDRTLCGRMPGVVLNARGNEQARAAGRRLATLRPLRILTSPLERARGTADIIGEETGCPVEAAEALQEIDCGEWTGKAFDELHKDPRWKDWNEARAVTRPPGGEMMIEVQARAARYIESLRRLYDSARLILVSHSDVIKAAILFHIGLSLDLFSRIEVAPGSISTLVIGDWGARVVSLNETCT
jgi:broad specificity phosphatase PhoE